MPYLPFPEDWPVLTPKAMLADWLEAYAKGMYYQIIILVLGCLILRVALQINMWTSTTLDQPTFDETTGVWAVTIIRPDGRRRIMHPKHLVRILLILNLEMTTNYLLSDCVHGNIWRPTYP